MKAIVISLCLLCVAVSLSAGFDRVVIRIDNPDTELYRQMQARGEDIASYKQGEYLDLVIESNLLEVYQRDYPGLSITQTEEQAKSNLRLKTRDIPGYRDYSQMHSELVSLQSIYPNLMTLQTIGTGWGAQYAQTIPYYEDYNHQIWAVKVSANVHEEEDEPALYIVGEHHAREPISLEVSMEILIYLLEHYGVDTFVTSLLDHAQIWIVPLLNPDGHKVVIDQNDVWWRKNIRDNNNNQQFNTQSFYGYGSDGVDLNRNYGYNWGYISATDNTSEPLYHGPNPFSEPETMALKALLESQPFLAGISYHTYGQYVLYPYGYIDDVYAPDHEALRSLAMDMAYQIEGQSGGYYHPMPAWELYPTSGGSDDWIYGELGTFAYTVEMATEFIPSASEIDDIVANNLQGALVLLNRLNHSMLKGHVTDAYTGLALEATILVDGIDNAMLPKGNQKTVLPWGSYYRLLSPGQHVVNFHCEGYQSVTETVQITETGVTELEIALIPLEEQGLYIKFIEDGNPDQPLSGVSLSFIEPFEGLFFSDAEGRIDFPELFPGYYRLDIYKEGYNRISGWCEIADAYTFSMSQNTVINDGFEAGLTNWTASGYWGITATDAYNGSGALADSPTGSYYINQNSTCRLTEPIDLSGAVYANLSFWVMHGINLDGDYAALEYSLNGSTWQNLDFYTGSENWHLVSYDLSSLIGDQFWIRFRISTNENGTGAGIQVDDFRVYVSYHETVDNQDEHIIPARLSLYPNPAQDKIFVRLEGQEKSDLVSIEIFNLRGQRVHAQPNLSLTDSYLEISLKQAGSGSSKLGSGLYVLRVLQNNKLLADKKFIIVN